MGKRIAITTTITGERILREEKNYPTRVCVCASVQVYKCARACVCIYMISYGIRSIYNIIYSYVYSANAYNDDVLYCYFFI